MGLIEFLVAYVGSSVAKTILKFWVRDSDFAQDVGTEIIDFLKSKVSDGIASKRGSRQFEEIAEKVAESLVPLFEHENLNEDDKKRISQAVGEAIGNLRISAELLVKKNLEPSELARFIRHSNATVKNSLSAAECAFYDRLVDQCSQYIVDIASQLPGFTEKTFAEVLRRQDELRNIAADILKKMTELQQKSQEANIKTDFARFEADYRLAVMQKLDLVELFGVDVSAPSRRHRLSVAYISLTASGAAPPRKTVDSPTGLAAKNKDRQVKEGESPLRAAEQERITQSVEEVLAARDRLLIRGEAGSGKTTLLKWIAVQSSARKLQN